MAAARPDNRWQQSARWRLGWARHHIGEKERAITTVLQARHAVAKRRSAVGLTMPLLLKANADTGTLSVPGGLVGLTFSLQAWGFAPGVDPADRVFRNGLRIVLGV